MGKVLAFHGKDKAIDLSGCCDTIVISDCHGAIPQSDIDKIKTKWDIGKPKLVLFK